MAEFIGQHPWWMWLFFVVGVFGAASFFISLFFALGRRPQRMWTEEIGAVDSPDFLRPIAALLSVPLRDGGRAELLENGDAWLPRLLEDIATAKRSINFSVYIWEQGRMSDQVFPALIERARAGVEVRVLLDGLGGMRCPDGDVEALRAAGGKVASFRPLKFGMITRFHRRNHRRAIVFDGTHGYTGGMAVGDKWLGNARNPDEWRDTMIRVTGCLAESLQSAFSEPWAYVTGEVLTGDAFFPDEMVDDDCDTRSLGLISSPASEEHPLRLFFFLAFLAARKTLWITTPYFVPDKHTRQVLARRAKAGVDVRLLVPNELTDARPIRLAGQSYYQELLDAGVRIYEFQTSMIHTKQVVVDGALSIVGSANMDIRSKELNEENIVALLDRGLAQRLEQSFLSDLEQSREIVAAEWRKRGLSPRVKERLSVFFAEQY